MCLAGSLFLFLAAAASSAAPTSSTDTLIADAKQRGLASDAYWHLLLHYKPSFGGTRSLIDDPAFFLSPRGQSDPQAELNATIRAFTTPSDAERPPICRFPARYEWLSDQLPGLAAIATPSACQPFERFMDNFQVRKATLVFPSAYMNNPASMFGHTMLNLEGQSGEKGLVSKSISYAARSEETNGFLFAIKGIFGFYKGYFTILPYYARVQQYNDISQRDIWEYALNLNAVELRRLLLHMWELENVYSDYFFFDENCSYNLLFLLEAARPESKLSDAFSHYAMPVDTIRVVKAAGLVADAHFRPSRASRIRHLHAELPGPARQQALAVAKGEETDPLAAVAQLTPDEGRRSLELAAEIVQYMNARKKLSLKAYRRRFLGILRARSTMGDAEANVPVPAPQRPDFGHLPGRLGVGWHHTEGQGSSLLLRLRPAYHSLLDPQAGYQDGSEIAFLDGTLALDEDGIALKHLDAIRILSLSPYTFIDRPLSWHVSTGVRRQPISRDADGDWKTHHLPYLTTGAGISMRNRMGTFYALLNSDLTLGGGLTQGHSFAFGVRCGAYRDFTSRWRCVVELNSLDAVLGSSFREASLAVSQRWQFSPELGVVGTWQRRQVGSDAFHEMNVSLHRFF